MWCDLKKKYNHIIFWPWTDRAAGLNPSVTCYLRTSENGRPRGTVDMPRRLRLSTNFLRREAGFGDLEIADGVYTVAELLHRVERESGFILVDAEGEKLRPDIELTLRGKDIAFYPKGLRTEIEDGDWLDICLTPLGGG